MTNTIDSGIRKQPEFYQHAFDEFHAALLKNGFNNDVATFLANLAVDVERLKEVVQP